MSGRALVACREPTTFPLILRFASLRSSNDRATLTPTSTRVPTSKRGSVLPPIFIISRSKNFQVLYKDAHIHVKNVSGTSFIVSLEKNSRECKKKSVLRWRTPLIAVVGSPIEALIAVERNCSKTLGPSH